MLPYVRPFTVCADEFAEHLLPVFKANLEMTPVEMSSAHMWLAIQLFDKFQVLTF